MPSLASRTAWVESLSPWPEEFGLERMRALLADLGDPQRVFPAIHVVGTTGKGTAVRTIEELLASEGLHVGAYLSPHVSGWSERIRVGGREADFEHALDRVYPRAEGATQFEVLTASAFAEFAEERVDVAVVEAGLGGRLDATNVLDAPVVLLTNVALEHTEVLGDTREAIAREKLAVVVPDATAVLPDHEFANLVTDARVVFGGAREAAETFLGRTIDREVEVSLPGRFEQRAGGEIWDGAHTPEAADWLLERLPGRDYVLCISILRDKNVDAILERLARAGDRAIVTQSSNPRALGAEELAGHARRWFSEVEVVENPVSAVARAREAGNPVLVTGSLYLLADLYRAEEHESR
jgi:dihydrofolate synthase / folylpolyglutamate synthase